MSKSLDLTIAEVREVATDLARSGFFAVKNPAQAFAQVLAGQELGIPPFAALSQIHVIKGKPEVGASALAALVKRSGRYNYRVPVRNATRCDVTFYERWDGAWEEAGTSSFTIEMAKRAGLLRNPTWNKYPEAMLFARAMSAGVRTYCPDVTHGSIYHEGEISWEVEQRESPAPAPAPAPEVVDVVAEEPTPKDIYIRACKAHAKRTGKTARAVAEEIIVLEGSEPSTWGEDKLLAIAAAVEAGTYHGKAPAPQPTAPKAKAPRSELDHGTVNARLHAALTDAARLCGGEDKRKARKVLDALHDAAHALVRELSGVEPDAEWSSTKAESIFAVHVRTDKLIERLQALDLEDRAAEAYDTADVWMAEVKDARQEVA